MLKSAIVGCGKIADAHASVLRHVAGCELVAACDHELLMARQLCDRYGVAQAYADVGEMLRRSRPDVVHITTPPQTHFGLGKLCLENGCHVYIEKPFTVNGAEAEELLQLADRTGRRVTVGHDLQFSHAARRMRALVQAGFLGGPPVHLESYYCYDLGNASYAKALLGDKDHWVRRLPGRLLHNVISHGVARIAEFLPAGPAEVIARGHVSPTLQEIGEVDIIDELRVIIESGQGTTAYFTFSSQMRPALNQFRVYGPKHGLVLDEEHQTLIKYDGRRLKSYAEKFVQPVRIGAQLFGNVAGNAKRFLARDFHMKGGMKALVGSFYECIARGGELPIPYCEIVRTAQLMDNVFDQLQVHEDAKPRDNLVEQPAGAGRIAR